MKKFTPLLFLLILFNIQHIQSQQLFENFETADKIVSAYSGEEVALATGNWFIKGLTAMDDKDRYNGSRSVRLRGNGSDVEHRVEMLFDKANGIGTVSFKYGSYSTHNNGKIRLYTSTDGGTSWVKQGNDISVLSWEASGRQLSTANITVNIQGNARIKIEKLSASGSTSLNIDDIEITDYTGVNTSPRIITDVTGIDFGNIVIGTNGDSRSITMSGENLTDFITYSLKEDGWILDPLSFSIDKSGWNKETGGTLVISFNPNQIRDYAVKLELKSDGASDVIIPIIGSGVEANPALSADATLSDLQIDGTTIEGFASERFYYLHILPEGYEGLPILTAIPNDAAAVETFTQPQSIPEVVHILVTAEDGTTLNYTVDIRDQASVSSDATLASLAIDGVTVTGFSSAKTEYSYMFPSNYAGIPVISATTNDPASTLNFDQPTSLPADVAITVTAEDGTTTIYNLYLRPYYAEPILTNYIGNGGFEQWLLNMPEYWHGSQTNCEISQSHNSHNGLYAVELINAGSGEKLFSTEAVNIAENYGYETSFWVKGKGDIRIGLYYKIGDEETVIYGNPVSIDSDQWVRYTDILKSPVSSMAQFVFAVKNTDGLLIDDVFVYSYVLVEPEITTDLAEIEFENTYYTESSEKKTLTVSSKDLSEPIVYSLKGNDPTFFTIEEGDDWNNASGGELHITFNPMELRNYSAILEIVSEGVIPVEIPLRGTGVERSGIATLSAIQINGTILPGFAPAVYDYNYMLPEDEGTQAEIAVTPTDKDADIDFETSVTAPTVITIDVTSPNDLVTLQYTIRIVPFFDEPEGNYTTNGGFEQWTGEIPDEWNGSRTTGTAVFAKTTDSYSGFYAVELIRESGSKFRFSTQALRILENYRYQISYWVKGKGDINTGCFNGSANVLSESVYEINSTEWEQKTDLLEPGATSDLAEIFFEFSNTNGLYIDEVVITPIRILYPEMTADPLSLDFGAVYITDQSSAQEITVEGIDLSDDISYSLTGEGNNTFSVSKKTGWSDLTGGTLSVVFAPAETKTYNVNLIIDQPEVTPITIALTGSGLFKSSDATLSSILIDGQPLAGFTPSTTSYEYIVPLSYNGIPTVTASESQASSTHTITDATAIPGTTLIEVTAHNGSKTTYSVHFIRSSVATLSSIKVDNVQLPDFSPDKTEYLFMLVENYSGMPQVSATAGDAANGATVAFAQPTSLPTVVSIVVTAANGTTKKTYSLRIVPYYKEPENFIDDGGFELWNSATALTHWGGSRTNQSYTQTQDSYEGFYAVSLVNNTSTERKFTTKQYTLKYDYYYSVNFMAKGKGNLRTGVYDGAGERMASQIQINSTQWQAYTQEVFPTQASTTGEFIFGIQNAEGLILDNVIITEHRVLHPAISTNVDELLFGSCFVLEASYPRAIVITATDLTEPLAYTIEGTDAAYFFAEEGEWSATGGGILDVFLEPTEERDYSATLVFSSPEIPDLSIPLSGTGIPRDTDATLEDLTIDRETIEGFSPDITDYEVIVYKAYAGIPEVDAERNDPLASVRITQATTIPGSAQVVVTAHDWNIEKTYTVNFVRSTDATLSAIKIDGASLPGFSPEVSDYEYMLPGYAAAMPVITATPAIAGAQVVFSQPAALPQTVSIKVIAEDDLTEKIYTVRVVDYFEEPGNNYLSQGGFEQWTGNIPDYWVGNKTDMIEVNYPKTSDSHWGYLAVALKNSGATPKDFSTQPISVLEGLEYKISFYAKGSGNIRTGLYDGRGTGNGIAYNDYIAVNTDTWILYSQNITPARTTDVAEFILSVNEANLIVDDVVIVPISGTEPIIMANTQELDFGNTYIEDTSDAQKIIIAGANLTEEMSFDVSGDSDVFSVEKISWKAESRGVLGIVYSPVSLGEDEATLTFKSAGETLYTIVIKGTGIARRTDATLAGIMSDGTPVENFDPDVAEYNLIVPVSHPGVPEITVNTSDALAKADITQAGTVPGDATIKVTAHDNVTVKTYKVHFVRSAKARLIDLQIDGSTVEDFDPAVHDYYITLPEGYTAVPNITAVPEDKEYGAEAIFEQPAKLPCKVIITVQSADKTNEAAYTLYLNHYSIDYSASILKNGSFEFWTESGDDTVLPDFWFGSKTTVGIAGVAISGNPADGDYACEIINTQSGHKRFTTKGFSVEKDILYDISFSARGIGDIRTGLFDNRSDNDGFSDYNEYIRVNSNEWTTYTQSVRARNTTDIAELIFSVHSTIGLYIDKVIVRIAIIDNINTANPADAVYAYNADGRLIVENTPVNSVVNVYDISGQLIEGKKAVSNKTEFVLPARGSYLITITSKHINKTIKVIY